MRESYLISKKFGYMTIAEIDYLASWARGMGEGKVIVNIGAGGGTSGLVFAETAPYATRYSIDIVAGPTGQGLSGEKQSFENTGLVLPLQVVGDSDYIGKTWKSGEVDLLFIDGDHRDAGVERDILAWKPNVKTGGLIIFHDFGHPHWNIAQVAGRLMVDCEFLGVVDTTAAYRKTA